MYQPNGLKLNSTKPKLQPRYLDNMIDYDPYQHMQDMDIQLKAQAELIEAISQQMVEVTKALIGLRNMCNILDNRLQNVESSKYNNTGA